MRGSPKSDRRFTDESRDEPAKQLGRIHPLRPRNLFQALNLPFGKQQGQFDEVRLCRDLSWTGASKVRVRKGRVHGFPFKGISPGELYSRRQCNRDAGSDL